MRQCSAGRAEQGDRSTYLVPNVETGYAATNQRCPRKRATRLVALQGYDLLRGYLRKLLNKIGAGCGWSVWGKAERALIIRSGHGGRSLIRFLLSERRTEMGW